MICGYARHGKDTVAEILRDDYDYKFESSSHFALRHFIREELKLSGLVYPTDEACYNDRVNHRELWHNIIKEYNRDDLTRLTRGIFADNDIYVGIRSIEEFQEAKEGCLFDLSIWVRRPGMQKEPRSSNTISEDDCDVTLVNSGTLGDLVVKVHALADLLITSRNY